MESDPAIRCGVLRANGRNFTAGLELSKLSGRFAEGRSLFSPDEIDPVNLRKLRTKPVVAADQGICFTLGIELMLAADTVVAASDCRFAQLEVQRGIMASAGATQRPLHSRALRRKRKSNCSQVRTSERQR
jgi:enoyl-CoA hydratase/carnithine racemase